MYVDNPEALRSALPRLLAGAAAAGAPEAGVPQGFPAGDAFMSSLQRALGDPVIRPMADPPPVARLKRDFWCELILMNECGRSQYDALREAVAAAGEPAGNVACLALTGAGFHGQQDRPWATARGNLHLSAVVACDLPAAVFAPVMPAWPAVAIAEAVAAVGGGGLDPRIKWVNDILLDDRKVAGSLTALRTRNGRITAVFVGIGLNVQVAPDPAGDTPAMAPAALAQLAAHLPGGAPDLAAVLLALLDQLAARFNRLLSEGPAGLLGEYRNLSAVIGRRVELWPGPAAGGGAPAAARRTALVTGIADDLGLVLADGQSPVTAGRLVLLPRDGTEG